MSETAELLGEYAKDGSETAFRELVSRYIDFVYSSALRMVGGDAHLAQDVCQNVFIDLARNAQKLSRETMLGGWLHRDTCFVAGKLIRTERRRAAREREAALMNSTQDHSEANLRAVAPVLDDAINNLDAEDRAAIIARFFEQQDFRTIGATLGSNEDAARMRVNRALQKLHLTLKRQGISMSAAALGTALAAEAVTAAPAGLAITVATAALAKSITTGAATTAIKIMAFTKTHAAIVGAIVAIAVTGPLFLVHESKIKSDAQLQMARAQKQMASLADDNASLSNSLADANTSFDRQQNELLRLRGAARSADAKATARTRQTRPTPTASTPQPNNDNQEPPWAGRAHDGRNIVTMLIMHANEHSGRLPDKVEDLGQYASGYELTGTNTFEIVYHGALTDLKDTANTIVVRESGMQRTTDNQWSKVYGFADGHAELHTEPYGHFENYEKEHGIAAR
ncbi:MAG: hypothetical protein JWO95_332 [Verrucomicrobiales bacterium]|nr:hypothetical protein [Verrucomicrobiales bacterium]